MHGVLCGAAFSRAYPNAGRRRQARASAFHHLLTLAADLRLKLEQEDPGHYGEIVVSRGSAFSIDQPEVPGVAATIEEEEEDDKDFGEDDDKDNGENDENSDDNHDDDEIGEGGGGAIRDVGEELMGDKHVDDASERLVVGRRGGEQIAA